MPLGAADSYAVTVVGRGEVPPANVMAVVANVTATDGSAPSFLTVWPSGAARPGSSSVNFAANETTPNHTTVGVGSDGKIAIYNDTGAVNVIVDVVGYYTTAAGTTGAGYLARTANFRALDTRSGAPIPAGGTRTLVIPGLSPAVPFTAAAFNLTVDQARADGFITAYPSGSSRSNASSLNFTANRSVANLVTAKLGTGSSLVFYNGSADIVHLIVDIVGAYVASPTAPSSVFRLVAGGPLRAFDTRASLGRAVAEHEVLAIPTNPPNTSLSPVVGNLTVTGPASAGYATVFVPSTVVPPYSTLNFRANETRANQFIWSTAGTNRAVDVLNESTGAHYIVDIVGGFAPF